MGAKPPGSAARSRTVALERLISVGIELPAGGWKVAARLLGGPPSLTYSVASADSPVSPWGSGAGSPARIP